MNTSELICLLSRALRNTSCRFLGVFAADEAPTELPHNSDFYPCAFVINTDVASEPGHHWVACYVSSPNSVVEFFDSYGNPSTAYPNLRLTTMSRLIRRASSVSFQSSRSLVCGHYCVFYLCKRTSGWSAKSITNVLMRFAATRSTRLPYPQDRLVRRFVRNLRSSLPCTQCCLRTHLCTGNQCCTRKCRQ
jgi:hypothetical protein